MNKFVILAAAGLLTGPAFADGHASGDAEAGEKVFNQCQSCHIIKTDDGEVLAGRSARTGPNLYGIPGSPAGSKDFRYGKGIEEAADMGLVWNEETFVKYVMDPTGYLREFTGNDGARGKMSFKLRKEEDAVNVWAFIASVSPEPEGEGKADPES
ncbi:c-type cytochrome [Oceaniglobus indicus]|uniref:c-type cytochrome n=1 Tax=Oceaniglobus indicus TaxID=2047749 RepID=UPI000C175075|nr:c-type cytochrome [Oceaniglobus indicus]